MQGNWWRHRAHCATLHQSWHLRFTRTKRFLRTQRRCVQIAHSPLHAHARVACASCSAMLSCQRHSVIQCMHDVMRGVVFRRVAVQCSIVHQMRTFVKCRTYGRWESQRMRYSQVRLRCAAEHLMARITALHSYASREAKLHTHGSSEGAAAAGVRDIAHSQRCALMPASQPGAAAGSGRRAALCRGAWVSRVLDATVKLRVDFDAVFKCQGLSAMTMSKL